jgi:hypothetical protein
LREKVYATGFNAFGGAATAQFAEKEKFENVMLNRRMVVFVAIINSREFFHDDVEAGFFFHFANGGETRRIADVGPSAGQRPQAVGAFFDEQDPIGVEDRSADVDLWRGVAFFKFEALKYGCRFVEAGASGHDFGGDAAEFVVALLVVRIFAVGQPVLRERLQATRPFEPAPFILHIGRPWDIRTQGFAWVSLLGGIRPMFCKRVNKSLVFSELPFWE